MQKEIKDVIKVGCCGFGMAHSKYFEAFRLVEIQQTFYQPPKIAAVAKWRAVAPKDFEFTLKAWQLITHEPSSSTYQRIRLKIPAQAKPRYGSFKPTKEVFQAWETTAGIADALGARIVVFQCPAQFKPVPQNIENLRDFMKKVNRHGLRFVWEPRGKWHEDLIKSLCEELDLIHCIDPFKSASVVGKPFYFRLHGIKGYYYRFTDADLAHLLEMCRDKKEVYCLFNNVSMAEDAKLFMNLVCGKDRYS